MFGLSKPRSKFGKWLDKQGLTQNEIAKEAKVGTTTVSNMCSDPKYIPRVETWVKIERALRTLGYNVKRDDFFNL